MASVLNFSDLGCLNESASGSMGAGLASLVRAGFPVARGFVVTPIAFSDYLKKPEIAATLDLHRSGAEDPEASWRSVKALFGRVRMNWNHEMEILASNHAIGSTVSMTATSIHGAAAAPLYGSGGEDVLAGIKQCWLKWLRGNMGKLEDNNLPAVIVREVLDSEVSVELRKKGFDIHARAVFGLPEGLYDSTISGDVIEFGAEGKPDRTETRAQNYQFIMKDRGPAKVEISSDFTGEEKLSGEMMAGLNGIMSFMRETRGLVMCTVCFVDSRPVVCSAAMSSDAGSKPEIPPREQSISLLGPAKHPVQAAPAPVVAARLFLSASGISDMGSIGDAYADGILATGIQLSAPDVAKGVASFSAEAKRRFGASSFIIEVGETSAQAMGGLAGAFDAIMSNGMQPGLLIPGIRSTEELARTIRQIKSGLPAAAKPEIWLRVMYPSNLYFLDSLAGLADVLALDLNSLGKLMMGAEQGKWVRHSAEALEKALGPVFASRAKPIAVISEDLVSTPGLLEFLVRNGTDILCPGLSEMNTVRHIAASVEKRMLIEQGR